jgi:hypothetical protein
MPAQEGARAAQITCDPAWTQLFTPPPLMGRYEVCATDERLEALVERRARALRDDRPQNAEPGPRYGAIEALEALDAFGAAGNYQRAALARLYGGGRVRVARGWSASAGRFESITLLSPYPDASLTHLLPGTLEIRWILPAGL